MRKFVQEVLVLLVLVGWISLSGCIDPLVAVPTLALPVAAALLVQTNEKKAPPAQTGGGAAVPTATPAPTPAPAPTFAVGCPPTVPEVGCTSFRCQPEAQAFFEAVLLATGQDCHFLDQNENGKACEALPATCN